MGKKKDYTLDILIGGAVGKTLKTAVKEAAKQLAGIDDKKLKKFASAATIGAAGIAAIGKTSKTAFDITKKAAKFTLGATTAVVDASVEIGKASVKNASTFQKEMANVSTLLSGTPEEVSKMTSDLNKDILKISNTTGVVTSGLTDGLYQVVSAFGYTKESAKITELAAKSGAAGCATTTDAVNLLSAVTKAYGDTSYEAQQKVSDMAFETVRLGQTSYGELASSIQQVTALSNSMGVSQEELFGVFATGTGVIGSAAEVGTKLKAVYTKLQKPTKDMTVALKAMGYASGEAAIADLGLQGTLEAITNYSEKNKVSLASLYGSSNAAILATALTSDDLSSALTEKTKAMGTAGGATDTAFLKQIDTFDKQVAMVKNIGQNVLTQIGLEMLPVLTDMVKEATPLISDTLENVMPTVSEIIGAVMPAISDIAKNSMPTIKKMLEQASPIVNNLIIRIMPVITESLENILPIVTEIFDTIDINSLLNMIDFDAIVILAQNILPLILTTIQNLMPLIQPLLQLAMGVINGVIVGVGNLVAIIVAAVNGLLSKIKGSATSICNIIIKGINWIIQRVNSFIDKINGIKVPVLDISLNLPHIAELPQVALATGGIVTKPTTALIGEGKEPEAVMPLTKLENFLNNDYSSSTENNTETISFVFSPTIYYNGNADKKEINDLFDEEYKKFKAMMMQWQRENRRVAFA